MFIQYNNLAIHVSLGGYGFRVLNIARERLCRIIPSHSHGAGCYEMHYISEGRGKVLIDGALHPLAPGSVYIVGPHAAHAQIPDHGEPPVEICIYLQAAPPVDAGQCPFAGGSPAERFWMGAGSQRLAEDMDRLFEELRRQDWGYTFLVEALLAQILVDALRSCGREPAGAGRQFSRASLSDARAFIIEEAFLYAYASLTLEQLAGQLGASVRQTQRMLACLYNKTFREKRSDARMSAAVILLAYTDRPVWAVSEELGYATAASFSEAFKKSCGLSPVEYRKKRRGPVKFPFQTVLEPPEGLKSARVLRE